MKTFKELLETVDKKPFKDRKFYMCYNIGYGEKGCSAADLSFQRAKDIINDKGNDGAVKEWINNEDGYYEFKYDYYMLDEYHYNRTDW